MSVYVLRLRESQSLQSRHFKATDLALNAFMLVTTGRMMADESDKLASFVLAADSPILFQMPILWTSVLPVQQ